MMVEVRALSASGTGWDHRSTAADAASTGGILRERNAMIALARGTHACVRLQVDDVVLVVDPGEFGVPEDLAAADAVLITHDHFDHVDHAALRKARETNGDLLVVGPAPVAESLPDLNVRIVDGGDDFEVRGVPVQVLGHVQAVTSLEDPPIPNVGYLVAGTVLHPGDALHELDVDTLLLPMEVPWAKNVDRELALRRHPPRRIVPIHDGTLNELGLDFSRRTLEGLARAVGAEAVLLREGDGTRL